MSKCPKLEEVTLANLLEKVKLMLKSKTISGEKISEREGVKILLERYVSLESVAARDAWLAVQIKQLVTDGCPCPMNCKTEVSRCRVCDCAEEVLRILKDEAIE